MRYVGPVRFRYFGNVQTAQTYEPAARALIGSLLSGSSVPFSTRSVVFGSGVEIVATVISQPEGSDRDRIESPIAAAMRGRYIVTAQIYAPRMELLHPEGLPRIYQYQFTYAGPVGEPRSPELVSGEGKQMYGGSVVGAIFVIWENRVDYASFPLVSNLKKPPQGEPDKWPYVEKPLSTQEGLNEWLSHLIFPRYEIGLASSETLKLPRERDLVFSAWMPKGERHYLSQAYTPTSMTLLGAVQSSPGGVSLSYRRGVAPTDVGYETSLSKSKTPSTQEPEVLEMSPNPTEDSAPDTDWYSSYGVHRVEYGEGEVEFGVMVDASQRVHVWPLEAAGTGVPDPEYGGQSIKTNVAEEFAFSQQLVFPPEVDFTPISYRDLYYEVLQGEGAFVDGPLRDSTRYIWAPSPDGSEYSAIVEVLHPQEELKLQLLAGDRIEPLDPYYLDEEKEYRISSPQTAVFSIEISKTGSGMGDFEVEVSPVELQEAPPAMTPFKVGYAQAGAFPGVGEGERLTACFEVRRVSEAIDDWGLFRNLTEGIPPMGQPLPLQMEFMNFNASDTPGLPAPLTAYMTYRDNFAYMNPVVPRIARQDWPFVTLEPIIDSGNVLVDIDSKYSNSFVLEGRLVVLDSEGEEVFSKCCRKYKKDLDGFGNFFTARVDCIDLPTGSVAFGLCDSTQYNTLAELEVLPFPVLGGVVGNWYPHRGEFTSDKGYAIYHRGELVKTNDPSLSSQLDTELESFPLDKEWFFWGTFVGEAPVTIPPAIIDTYVFVFGRFNVEYEEYMRDLGYTGTEDSIYGIPNYPWGKEIHSWFAWQHCARDRSGKSNLTAGEDFLAYAGAYLDVQTEMQVSMMTSEAIKTPSLAVQPVDVILAGGREFSHAGLYEEAFGEEPGLDFNVEFENSELVVEDSEGNPIGYPFRIRSPAYPPDQQWDTEKFFSPQAVFKTEGGTPVATVNLYLPEPRMYCDLGYSLRAKVDAEAVDGFPGGVFQTGALHYPFHAQIYGIVEIEEV